MRKITYKGSIADDVNFLKKGNSRTIKACGLGIVGFALTGFLPVSVPVTVAAAGFLGFGGLAVGSFAKLIYTDLIKKPKVQKRVYKLLDLMGVSKEVNEHDIKVASNVPMKVRSARKVKSTLGNYIIVNDKKEKQVIKEVQIDDLKAYKQFLLDMKDPKEAHMAKAELRHTEDVVAKRRRR
jgi:hypothetical protein